MFFLLSGNLSKPVRCNHIVMNPIDFFKTLKYKINQYDKAVSNPFENNKSKIVIIWIEDNERPMP